MSKRNGSKELKVTKRYAPDIQAQVAALEILLRSSPAKETITENEDAPTNADNLTDRSVTHKPHPTGHGNDE